MRAVAPVPTPIDKAMMIKKTGNDIERAARASLDNCPAIQVSTTLYMVLKKKPTAAGSANCIISLGIGWEVNPFEF
jgi:hypothetical protein